MGHFPSCSICIEVFVNFGDVSASPCGHTFHRECLTSWASQCESKGQLPTCPTCSKPFESGPAKGIIESLFFSFDADGQSGDEFLAKQMNENVKLSEDVAARDAEIRDLRAKLARSEADLKELRETCDKEKKAREAQERVVATGDTEIRKLRAKLIRSDSDLKKLGETDVTAHDAEICDLRAKLARSEADIKQLQETCDEEKKARETWHVLMDSASQSGSSQLKDVTNLRNKRSRRYVELEDGEIHEVTK